MSPPNVRSTSSPLRAAVLYSPQQSHDGGPDQQKIRMAVENEIGRYCVEPDGVFVFYPTMDEMRDFAGYISYMEKCGAHEVFSSKMI